MCIGKSKFDFLAAFSVVALFYMFVAIISARYMRRKLLRYDTTIMSHKIDKSLLIIMILLSVLLCG